jgi:proteasome accessory factor C
VSAPERVPRLLALLPWLVAHPGVSVTAAATHFHVSTPELISDINLLTMTGPGQFGGDLVDVQIDISDQIYVQDAQSLSRPLRLTTDEATALLVGVRLLGQVPGGADRESLLSAEAKLPDAVAGVTTPGVHVAVTPVAAEVSAAVDTALNGQWVLHLKYLGATRDEVTERDVDPVRTLVLEGRSYLEAWCHNAAAIRTFRLDRVLAAEVTDRPAQPPVSAPSVDLVDGRLVPEGDLVTLELSQRARWVIEQVPVESILDSGDGTSLVMLRAADDQWVVRLALALGGDGQLVAPPRLVELVRNAASRALAGYAT